MKNEIVKADTMGDLVELGKALVGSGYFQDASKISQAIVKVLAGREMGFGPIAAMTGIHIIKGKPAVGANLMAAAVKSHQRYDYRITQIDDNAVVIQFLDNGKPCGESSFTAADAKRAGTQNMGKFPRNMLFARAMSNGVKWFCPDVFFGSPVYTPDELGVNFDGDSEIIDATPVIIEEAPPPAPEFDAKADAAMIKVETVKAKAEAKPEAPLTHWPDFTNKAIRELGYSHAEHILNTLKEMQGDEYAVPFYTKGPNVGQVIDAKATWAMLVVHKATKE